MDKDEQILRRRFKDLATAADNRGGVIYSDFLNMNEQSILTSMKQELPKIKYFAYGGFQDAERKILCFCGNEHVNDIEQLDFPISCIKIMPTNQKFSDALTHRDFLGAVLNLGIDRSKIGDILILENEGYLFCTPSISTFITDQLVKVKHTVIRTSIIDRQDFEYKPKYKEITGTVSSVRLDSILSVAFHGSRSSLSGLIEGGKVFVNSKEVLSNSYQLKENDIVSVRGFGKFIYAGTDYQTKKGRYSVKILLYGE
jgi:RNA-binding protein YlmH